MKALKYCALFAVVALVAVACQSAPEVTEVTEVTEARQLKGAEIAAALDGTDVFLLDVRRANELEEQGAIEGYTRIHIDELEGRLDELPADRPILVI